MIQIEEPPDVRACTTCMSPLTWIWVHHLSRNVAVVPVAGVDRFTFRIHTCELKAERTWRHLERYPPEVRSRGARRARAVLAANAQKRTKKEDS
jgi:hypothetical protein